MHRLGVLAQQPTQRVLGFAPIDRIGDFSSILQRCICAYERSPPFVASSLVVKVVEVLAGSLLLVWRGTRTRSEIRAISTGTLSLN